MLIECIKALFFTRVPLIFFFFFFLIGKKNFIKESQCVHKICTKRPNSYKIEGEAETEFKEAIKSATQLAVEKPHTLDQSNKELANFSRI